MLGGVENFCHRHAVEKNIANNLQLLAEELVINIVTPQYGACSLNMNFSEKRGTYELSVSYEGENINALDKSDDELSSALVKGHAKEIRHEYAVGANTITALL
jgi:hypothetical protein